MRSTDLSCNTPVLMFQRSSHRHCCGHRSPKPDRQTQHKKWYFAGIRQCPKSRGLLGCLIVSQTLMHSIGTSEWAPISAVEPLMRFASGDKSQLVISRYSFEGNSQDMGALQYPRNRSIRPDYVRYRCRRKTRSVCDFLYEFPCLYFACFSLCGIKILICSGI